MPMHLDVFGEWGGGGRSISLALVGQDEGKINHDRDLCFSHQLQIVLLKVFLVKVEAFVCHAEGRKRASHM